MVIDFSNDREDMQDIEFEEQTVVPVMATSHDMLDHRDYPDQHPIESITRLGGELADRPSTEISDADILAL